MKEAEEKISRYDELEQEFEAASKQLKEEVNRNEFLQRKLDEYSADSGVIETRLEAKEGEVKKLNVELNTQKEYHLFYKG